MSDDPWDAAREKARHDVASALAPRVRTCPACGREQSGPGRRCSNCGEDLVQIRPRWRPGRTTLIGGAVALALVAAFVLALVPVLRRGADERAREDRERQSRLTASELRRLTPAARAHTARVPGASGQAPLEFRRGLVRRAETLITADARSRVSRKEIKGPVGGTTCSPYPETAARVELESERNTIRRRYECVAFRYRFELPKLQGRARTGVLGTPFWAVIDDRRGAITWCKISPRAGEGGGRQLVTIPVPAACREPATGS